MAQFTTTDKYVVANLTYITTTAGTGKKIHIRDKDCQGIVCGSSRRYGYLKPTADITCTKCQAWVDLMISEGKMVAG